MAESVRPADIGPVVPGTKVTPSQLASELVQQPALGASGTPEERAELVQRMLQNSKFVSDVVYSRGNLAEQQAVVARTRMPHMLYSDNHPILTGRAGGPLEKELAAQGISTAAGTATAMNAYRALGRATEAEAWGMNQALNDPRTKGYEIAGNDTPGDRMYYPNVVARYVEGYKKAGQDVRAKAEHVAKDLENAKADPSAGPDGLAQKRAEILAKAMLPEYNEAIQDSGNAILKSQEYASGTRWGTRPYVRSGNVLGARVYVGDFPITIGVRPRRW